MRCPRISSMSPSMTVARPAMVCACAGGLAAARTTAAANAMRRARRHGMCDESAGGRGCKAGLCGEGTGAPPSLLPLREKVARRRFAGEPDEGYATGSELVAYPFTQLNF